MQVEVAKASRTAGSAVLLRAGAKGFCHGQWCTVRVRAGREAATAEALRRALPANVLTDAFVPRKQRWFKRDGAWSLQAVAMYPGYLIAVTKDVDGLTCAVRRVPLKAEVTGRLGGGERRWIEANADSSHIVRASEGVIEGGVLRVLSGPLAGQEDRVLKIDRHKRVCVALLCCEGGRAVTEMLALHVPEKR